MTRVVFTLSQCVAGPAGSALLALAGELSRRSHDVRLVVDRPGGGLAGAFAAAFPVEVLDAADAAKAGRLLPRALKAIEPERVIAIGRDNILLAASLRQLGAIKVPLIGWERDLLPTEAKGIKAKAARALLRSLYPACDYVVFPTPGAAAGAAVAGGKPINAVAIHDPCQIADAEAVTPRESELVAFTRTPRLMAIGPLTEQSDHATLLRAFQIFARAKGGSLIILGDGERRGALEALAASLGLGDRVVFESGVGNPGYMLSMCDLFVSAAKADVSGYGIVQALAAGVPVVATDCPTAPREILADGLFGKLAPVGDSRALWRLMRDTLEAIDARSLWNSKTEGAEIVPDRNAMRARAAEFSAERVVDKWAPLLGLAPHEEPQAPPVKPAPDVEHSAAP